ncbi:matrix protein [Wuhan Louse Fly Virus 5]|uniref:Matrix protein n=1 Tax=Wuhan Louse Fly Virus 5 TaxID=1608119 RepID=A0A0B5KF43_9RHAB|nr:matrix protein [Wuhan Louse Fly Virus 5]AJG39199.1 matrix protein [Wuhan Louse Fly Virus 5]
MLRLFNKKKGDSNSLLKDNEMDVWIPGKNFYSYESGEPSAPEWEDEITEITLRVQAKIEIKSKAEIQSIEDCLKILEAWIDEHNCPHWQITIDSWLFICLGLHARRDVTCKYTNLYRAQIDQVVKFKVKNMPNQEIKFKKHIQAYETQLYGVQCFVMYESNLSKTKRTGVPASVLYNFPIKTGNSPPKFSDLNIKLPIDVDYDETGNHVIKMN